MAYFKYFAAITLLFLMIACGGGSGNDGAPVLGNPTISLAASPSTIATNTNSTLSWTVTDATSCTASGGWTGSKNATSGSEVSASLTADTTFTLACTGAGGTTTDSVTVTVGSPLPTVALTATPTSIDYNATSTLSWTVTNATSCTASDGWTGSKNATSGTEESASLTADTTFTLTCTGDNGQVADSVSVTVAPFTRTLKWDPNTESDLAGYKVYYGTTSRDCDTSVLDEQFTYAGSQADQGASPIVIFVTDLNDVDNPEYALTNLAIGVDYHFAVTAFDLSGNESGYSPEATVIDEDSFPPALCDVSAATNSQIILDYSEFVEIASSSNIANYTLVDKDEVPVLIDNISFDSVTFKNVTLNTTSTLMEGGDYTLTVKDVNDFSGENPMSLDTKVFTYTNSPSIKKLSPSNYYNGATVTYSEKVTNSSAALSSNYLLDDPLNVTSVLVEDAKNVRVDADAALIEGNTYSVTINNITDLFVNTTLLDSLTFIQPVDNQAPLVLSAHVTNPSKNNSKVYVVFNEIMDTAMANDLSNYTIDNGISITSTSLFGDGRTVVLSTDAHPDGDYTITVSNITDNSVAANPMVTTNLTYKVITPIVNITSNVSGGNKNDEI